MKIILPHEKVADYLTKPGSLSMRIRNDIIDTVENQAEQIEKLKELLDKSAWFHVDIIPGNDTCRFCGHERKEEHHSEDCEYAEATK